MVLVCYLSVICLEILSLLIKKSITFANLNAISLLVQTE